MLTILLAVLIIMVIFSLPTWPHSREWGYWPSGGMGFIILIILLVLLMGPL